MVIMLWNVVRLLISDKAKGGQQTIVLNDNGHILNEPSMVSTVLINVLIIIVTGVGDDTGHCIRYRRCRLQGISKYGPVGVQISPKCC